MSVSLLVFVLTSNAKIGTYDVLSIVTACSFLTLGLFFFVKGKNDEKQKK
ncbi:DUF3188 domain-containing protein [Vagococcus elongatus]|nr:DUF3188 domain-containing protein [Vagococcus elongatus]